MSAAFRHPGAVLSFKPLEGLFGFLRHLIVGRLFLEAGTAAQGRQDHCHFLLYLLGSDLSELVEFSLVLSYEFGFGLLEVLLRCVWILLEFAEGFAPGLVELLS